MSQARRLGRRSGIGLVEAMVAVAIIGILLAVAVPNLSAYIHKKRMEGVANELIADLALMRVESLAKTVGPGGLSADAYIQVGYGGANNCYTVYIDDMLAGTQCDCRKPPGQACSQNSRKNNEIKVVAVPEKLGIKFSTNDGSNQARITRGQVFNPPGFAILIEGKQAGAIRIDIDGTGRPKACSPAGLLSGYPTCS